MKEINKRKRIFIIASLLVMVIASSIIMYLVFLKNTSRSTPAVSEKAVEESVASNKIISKGSQQAIESMDLSEQNNLLMGYKSKQYTKKDYSKIRNQIQQYLSDKQGKYGVYFKSLTSGQEWGINENEDYIAASTIKVPINLCLYDKVVKGEASLDDKLIYQQGDYEGGTGNIQYNPVGGSYAISDLSKLSIEISDNVAVNMLIRYLSRDSIYKYEESIVNHTVTKGKNVSNPKDMVMYMQEVLDFKEDHPDEGAQLLSYLENTIYNERLPRFLPKDVVVAHKIGSQVSAIHDVGIVFANKPYIIAVMSKDVDESQADEIIGRINKMVYDFEQK